MAQMPPEFISHDTVADMLVGDTRYVVPWAVEVDEDWQCWVRGGFPAPDTPGGTVEVAVTRRRDGYVIAPLPEHRWQPTTTRRADWLPVVEVVTPTPATNGPEAPDA